MTSISQKTFVISASILSVLAFLQLVVVVTVLSRKPSHSSALTPAVAPVPAPEKNLPVPVKKLVATPDAAPSAALDEAPVEPPPLIVPDSAEGLPISEIDIVMQRALTAREKGDMSGTLAGLRDAQKIFPDNPKILAEFATTYEAVGLVDKALTFWKRVADAGEKAGDLYGVAAEKIRMGVIPRDPPGGRDDEGLQAGSILGLTDVLKNYSQVSDNVEKVSLRVPIKGRSGSFVDAGRVNIQVMFYDLVNNTDVEPTESRVTSEWITPPADWLEDGVEVLRVFYDQSSTLPGQNPTADRKFIGYIVRVYYDNELQDVFAEPVKLLQTFPPSVTLQKEIPQ